MGRVAGGAEVLLLLLIHLRCFCHAMTSHHTSTWHEKVFPGPIAAPAYPPTDHSSPIPGPTTTPAHFKRHKGLHKFHAHSPATKPLHIKHHKVSRHASPPSTSPADCDSIHCAEPLTSTPIGSPCGCVYPIEVVIDLDIAPYLLFVHIAELEVEVAAGTFLKQSQVKIMSALPSSENEQKTRVTIFLVPLRDEFDNMTASLINDRIWQKKVVINPSYFGDYRVISVQYRGLPASPPSSALGLSSPSPISPLSVNVPLHDNHRLNIWVIVIVVVSSSSLIFACVGVILVVFRSRKLGRYGARAVSPAITPSRKRSARGSTLSTSIDSSISSSIIETCMPSVKTFSLCEIQQATEGFTSRRILGQGGFGRVYRGSLSDGTEVAVKLLTREGGGRDREFIAEVEMLSKLHHRNLVKLIGICVEGSKRCLVYELVPNGSVESHLHGADKEKGALNWETRMKIALGAARGLAYLHEDSTPRVIHRDFKASNILLEDDFTPKVTDFGLAREASEGSQHISTRVMGTFGYVDPEYAMTGHLLVKSDVYSYGVVLLELLSGRKPVYAAETDDQPVCLVTWARPLLCELEGVEKVVDPAMPGKYDLDKVAKVASIAFMCVHLDPSQRPFMGEVVQALKLICKDMDETCDDFYSHPDSSNGIDYDDHCGDFCPESSGWWNKASPGPDLKNSSPFVTMEYSSGRIEDLSKPSSNGKPMPSVLQNRSGPLRPKKKFTLFNIFRGSVSDHGRLPRHSRLSQF